MPNDARAYLRAKEVADFLGIAVRTLYRMRREKRGPPCIKLDGVFLFPRDEFEAWRKSVLS